MKLYRLGKAPWEESQLVYHALARLNQEALVLVSPAKPYVCLGFHQDAQQEVDLDYCRGQGLPVFRREVGGGAVYLDGDQLFWQLILKKDNPLAPRSRQKFYEKFLGPVVGVYRNVGLNAEYRPVNDVVAAGRKVCGTGVGEIGGCVVCVGNVIRDFDFAAMARVLKVPDEKFRDKLYKGLAANLATIKGELGPAAYEHWDDEKLGNLLAQEFARLLGDLQPARMNEELVAAVGRERRRMLDPAWLDFRRKPKPGRQVKLRTGVSLRQGMHKAAGGLMRARYELNEGRLREVNLSGDFFSYPPEAVARLEAVLEGIRQEEAEAVIGEFYLRQGWETPGVSVGDWLEVLNGQKT